MFDKIECGLVKNYLIKTSTIGARVSRLQTPTMTKPRAFSLFLFLFLAASISLYAQDVDDNQTCFECHSDEELTGVVRGQDMSVYVNPDIFQNSIHGEMACIDCHADIEEIPHEEDLQRVDCSVCHDDIQEQFVQTVHGVASIERKDRFAATCASCHGEHDILPSSEVNSHTYIMNIPATCGRCHKEGSPMTETHTFDEHNVVSNYSMSIHGKGLFQQGLKVTAVCTSCHGVHDILPHQHPESKINKNNVVQTCMQCHAQIEMVHEKVVEGQLWEKEPNKIPVCVECHSPHKIRNVIYQEEITDSTCLTCHSDPDLEMNKEGVTLSLFVDKDQLAHSTHQGISCVKCHFDVDPQKSPVCKESKPVDCSVCHAEQVFQYKQGIHGKLQAQNDPNAPDCRFCHGTHDILPRDNIDSPTFPRNVPGLCSRCHADGQAAAKRITDEQGIIRKYTMSIHGKGLMESGLMVTAMCTDCHTAHKPLPPNDPESSIHPNNVGKTCGTCHLGIYEQFKTSIHSIEVNQTDQRLPGCNDCHQSHSISRVDQSDFRTQILSQCGQCHKELTLTYFDTIHGKFSKLGEDHAAKCYDCHGSHRIFPISDPRSTLHRENIIDTCKKCHPGSHRKFTGYLTHATHHDKDKYPVLYYSFWFMTMLLVGTLGFFGLHTLLWLIRSLVVHYGEEEKRKQREVRMAKDAQYIRRFNRQNRFLHVLVILSFMSLALTGMTLKFPDVPLFEVISHVLGGPAVTSIIHRMGAIVTFFYFGAHLFLVARMLFKGEITLGGLLYKEYTMLPTIQDGKDLVNNLLWFIGLGEKPKFGRWTYWEKFDYFAVFWGVFIIGSTGLILWFPEWATHILPGWMINVATVIHSDEALLAAGFIFTIHFFNTHFRPGVFPMDPVIFTGRIPLEEFKHERPKEYQELIESGSLEQHLVGPPPRWLSIGATLFGLTFLALGLTIVATIVYGMVIVYI